MNKCNGHHQSFQKKINTVLCCKMEVANLFNTWLVSGCKEKLFRLYFS